MRKLLSANLSRLWRNKLLWAGMLVMNGMVIYQLIKMIRYMGSAPDFSGSPDLFLFLYRMPAVVITAVFMGFYIGTEYSDKTMRNKVIIGHSRASIYLANLLVCVFAAFLLYLTPMFFVWFIGVPLIGPFAWGLHLLGQTLLCSLLTLIAFVSLFLLVVMLIPTKAGGAVAVLLLSLALVISGAYLDSALSEPEFNYDAIVTDSEGNETYYGKALNPLYVSGFQRTLYEFLYDGLPGGQMYQYGSAELPQRIGTFPIYSAVLSVAFTAIGLACFRKKALS